MKITKEKYAGSKWFVYGDGQRIGVIDGGNKCYLLELGQTFSVYVKTLKGALIEAGKEMSERERESSE